MCPGCELPGLAAAVRRAAPGDRIRVRAGVYRDGAVVVDKPVEIIGEGAPVLDGGREAEGIVVRADDVVIRGLVVRNTGASFMRDLAGIRVEKARRCRIEDNRLLDTFFGVHLAEATECVVRSNEIRAHAASESFAGNAIHLWNCERMTIARNRVSGHRDGIYLEFVRGSRIEGNRSEGNLRYGLHFMFSQDNTYRGNTFRANGAGVAVMYSRGVTMEGNRFADDWGAASYGLLLKDLTDSRIAGNVFERNTIGLHAEGATRVVVEGNTFARNGWAARVLADSAMTFTRNRFVGNTFDVSTNSAHAASTFRENYWSDYRGYDLDRDGIGDVPHRPVRLFSLLVEQYPPAIILLRGPFLELLDLAERVLPILTPGTLADRRPRMRSGP
ncbi:MAG: nitrous oxide reductase family maturation protein NosD [Candidatus Rokubacteria bacterium]|nr:nitrous oxide reductase family maturation protein NosD [Candidatus Rokubacteria bacterium]